MLSLVAFAQLTEIDWRAKDDQVWIPSNHNNGRIVVLPAVPPMVLRSASGAEVRVGGRLEVRTKYRVEYAHCGTSMNAARLVWRRYLLASTDLTAVPTLAEQDALTQPPSPITSAATADVEVPAQRSPSSPAVLDDGED